jgi:hypothetical protein
VAADRVVALGDDLARAAAQRALRVGAEEVEGGPLDFVQHPGMALGRADLAHDGVRAVRAPVDRPDVLRHQRPRPAHRPRVTGIDPVGPLALLPDLVDRLDDRLDGGMTDLVAVQAALAGTAGREEVRVAQTSPASKSPVAWRTVTPHSSAPSSIAQSSDDGPRSPIGPGCTIRQRHSDQIDSGIIFSSIGHTISSGSCSATAVSMAAAESTTATVTS